jgi:hypothetical protein
MLSLVSGVVSNVVDGRRNDLVVDDDVTPVSEIM